MLLNILLGLIGLGLLVIIHEWGHFIVARMLGVEVEAFSVGWGPVLWHRKIGVTDYRLSAIPLGGYCKMKGAEALQEAIADNKDYVPYETGSFYSAAWWKRCCILAAGPAINVLLAMLFFWIVYAIGFSFETYPNRIVVDDSNESPALAAGLETGDYITRIQQNEVTSFEDIRRSIGSSAGSTVTVQVKRNSQSFTTNITPSIAPESGVGRIGVFPYIEPVVGQNPQSDYWHSNGLQAGDRIVSLNNQSIDHAVEFERILAGKDNSITLTLMRNGTLIDIELPPHPPTYADLSITWETMTVHSPRGGFFTLTGLAAQETVETLQLAARGLLVLFRGVDVTRAVSGPVQITYLVGEVATRSFTHGTTAGIIAVLQFMGLISVILAFMNMLPIPALDGGQILLAAGDRLSPRGLTPRFIVRYQNIGGIIVLLLIAFAVTSDIAFLFRG